MRSIMIGPAAVPLGGDWVASLHGVLPCAGDLVAGDDRKPKIGEPDSENGGMPNAEFCGGMSIFTQAYT